MNACLYLKLDIAIEMQLAITLNAIKRYLTTAYEVAKSILC